MVNGASCVIYASHVICHFVRFCQTGIHRVFVSCSFPAGEDGIFLSEDFHTGAPGVLRNTLVFLFLRIWVPPQTMIWAIRGIKRIYKSKIDKFIIIYTGLSAYGSECTNRGFFSGNRNDYNATAVGLFLMTTLLALKMKPVFGKYFEHLVWRREFCYAILMFSSPSRVSRMGW